MPPVSDTAPKLDEPIENKPIDTAAVTAPANTDGATEIKEIPKETPAEPKAEKKSFLAGFINKKPETKKEEPKEDKVPEPVAATETTPFATDAVDAPKTEETAPKEERPTVEKRRTSLFGGLGTIKKNKKDESETAEAGTERKREKSPLPSKIGGLFRKPSKAVKSEGPKPTETKEEHKTETPAEAITAPTEPAMATEAPATDAKIETPAATTDVTDSKIIGDVVPETLQAQDKVATAPEVRATA